MSHVKVFAVRWLAVAAAVLLSVHVAVAEPPPPWGSKLWPWNVQGTSNRSPAPASPPAVRAPTGYYRPASRASSTASPSPADANTVIMVAQVPEGAALSFDDRPTRQHGGLRKFESPSLTPGKTYAYTLRLDWDKGGEQMTKTQILTVRAGDVCIVEFGVPSSVLENEIDANLARLSVDDRAAARAQKFCAVEDSRRLGSLGMPFKVVLEGQPVFLCCDALERKALADSAKTLARARALRAKQLGADGGGQNARTSSQSDTAPGSVKVP